MAASYHPNGIGEDYGPGLVVAKHLTTTGKILFVHHTGSDANDGQDRDNPKATIGGAVSAATGGSTGADIIVCLDGHAETIVSVTLDKHVVILGAWATGGTPTVRLTPTAGNPMFLINAARHVDLRGLHFEEAAGANGNPTLFLSANTGSVVVEDCKTERGPNEDAAFISKTTGTSGIHIRNTTMLSTATVATAQPIDGILSTSGQVTWRLDGLVIDGGTVGWRHTPSTPVWAFYAGDNTSTIVNAEGCSLLRGADVTMLGTKGYWQRGTVTENGYVNWQPADGTYVITYPNGTGGTVGPPLVTGGPIVRPGQLIYVCSVNGTDSSNDGSLRTLPLATLSAALALAVDGGVIACLSGHTETLTSTQAISKKVTIVGEGLDSSGRPNVSFRTNMSTGSLFTIAVDSVQLKWLHINSGAQANSSTRVSVTGAYFRGEDLHFSCGATDTGTGLLLGGVDSELVRCKFVSTATSAASRPTNGLHMTSTLARLIDVTADAGTVGFVSGEITSETALCIRGDSLHLLNSARMILTNSTGYVACATMTGGAAVAWDEPAA